MKGKKEKKENTCQNVHVTIKRFDRRFTV